MNSFGFSHKKSFINPSNILGGIPGLFEDGFEKESSIMSAVTQAPSEALKTVTTGVFEAAADLFQDITGSESKAESSGKFSLNGSIDNFNQKQVQAEMQEQQKQQEESNRQKAFFQALKEDQQRAQMAKDKLLLEEEINDIATNLPTEQKNDLLHYQASYRDRSIYQRAELRRKLIEQRQKAEKQQKQATIASPAKQPSAIEGAFEGRSGSQGGGSANLSAQAVG